MAVVDLDLLDIFDEAFEMAGGTFLGGYDVRLARRSLNFIVDEWANRGLNLWTIDEVTVALTPSTATYVLASNTIDLIEHVVRDTDGVTDYTLRRLPVGDYAKLSKKSQTGRPTSIYVERLITPQVTLWPVPDKAYSLVYWALTRTEGLTSGGTGAPDAPSRFRPALAAGIALRVARAKGAINLIPMLEAEYEKQFRLAFNEDRDRAPYFITPGGGY